MLDRPRRAGHQAHDLMIGQDPGSITAAGVSHLPRLASVPDERQSTGLVSSLPLAAAETFTGSRELCG